jgi:hypothetical protein
VLLRSAVLVSSLNRRIMVLDKPTFNALLMNGPAAFVCVCG